MNLTTRTSADGKALTIQIKGKFDFNLVQSFRQAYAQIDNGTNKVIVDLRETDYMDSSALGMLLNMKKTLEDKVTVFEITNCQPQLKKILQISRFDKKFDIS
ncbi:MULTISPECIES: STAS domain-containing protein [unclassified Pseudoalteromonas]|jgi:anti-anti-sigma factor|uniref:STAS domain-containing protein n=1 Tax=unclassified Pseudoalteromonas TaxID=194690 RepID=UPI00073227AB|nr:MULTISPECIES: STAS domain-containing protein [unclassified Pseudoalteromonas]KTF19676.1 anti-anti-sigma factor [Pseudoalteromonas sp. 10-33]MBW4965219.1 STAS domain-containing protein [Pseudoalteromonas sp. CR1]TMN85759.1 glutaminase [Pseudoalteromonas sp. S410]TMN93087.1 glutaminase [Pseudoalteromonas sp. S408]TMN99578.1 glutaminase [Pseudoalteromonas sp. S407]|tara:strand:+ start:96 stop:401 length:306 start_codon:yes stop_codon:yes gene_type:complete